MTRWNPSPGAKLLAAAVGGSLLWAASWVPAANGRDDSWDDYRVLVERNIFLRDRRRWRPRAVPSTRPVRRSSRDLDDDIALTGVARRDGVFVAFFEDVRSGITFQIRAGQAVGQGKAVAISLDGVQYQRGEATRRIGVGRTLTGFVAAGVTDIPAPSLSPAPARPEPASRPGGEPTTGPAESTTQPAIAPARPPADGTGGDDLKSILERMRRRREQELRR
jgi:hypothetical protein